MLISAYVSQLSTARWANGPTEGCSKNIQELGGEG